MSLRNLKGDNLYLPLARLIVVCGISGAGKSTLIRDLLNPAVAYASKNKINDLKLEVLNRAGLFDLKRSIKTTSFTTN